MLPMLLRPASPPFFPLAPSDFLPVEDPPALALAAEPAPTELSRFLAADEIVGASKLEMRPNVSLPAA